MLQIKKNSHYELKECKYLSMSETCSTVDREKHNDCKYLSNDVASQDYLKKW